MKGWSTMFDDHITFWFESDPKLFCLRIFEDKIVITTREGFEKKFEYTDLLTMHKALTKIFGKRRK